MSSVAPAPKQAPNQRQPRWGDRGVSERLIVQDQQVSVTPTQTRITLTEAGILSRLEHHIYGPLTQTVGTGTINKDILGPYNLISWYALTAGANTPIISASGAMLNALQIAEYPGTNFEADADGLSAMDPYSDATNLFNFPASGAGNQTLRFWQRVPVALPWAGMPGGNVGYMVLQNKRVANIITETFAATGASNPYGLTSTTAGAAPFLVTGNATVTGSGVVQETWKTLHTVPDSRAKMPLFGFTRYIQEQPVPYSGSSFTYNFEPGGLLLRALCLFMDGGTTPLTPAQISTFALQYGVNKQTDVYTPYRNLQMQAELYRRRLPAGMLALDYYTRGRNTVDAKSTENTANIQILTQFPTSYTPAANSVCRILLDKVYIVQNRMAAA